MGMDSSKDRIRTHIPNDGTGIHTGSTRKSFCFSRTIQHAVLYRSFFNLNWHYYHHSVVAAFQTVIPNTKNPLDSSHFIKAAIKLRSVKLHQIGSTHLGLGTADNINPRPQEIWVQPAFGPRKYHSSSGLYYSFSPPTCFFQIQVYTQPFSRMSIPTASFPDFYRWVNLAFQGIYISGSTRSPIFVATDFLVAPNYWMPFFLSQPPFQFSL